MTTPSGVEAELGWALGTVTRAHLRAAQDVVGGLPGGPRGYQVLEELPYRERPLKAALRERGIGRLTIKKRGVDVVPDQLRKRLDLHGDAEATLVLTRVGGHGTALLVRPF